MRVKWATTCEQATVDARGAHTVAGIGVSVLRVQQDAVLAHTPIFASLSVPRHELDEQLDVLIVVTDPSQRPVGTQAHAVQIPSARMPAGAMDGYEVPAYLSTVVNFELGDEGPYSIFVTPKLRDGDPPPEPLTIFIERA